MLQRVAGTAENMRRWERRNPGVLSAGGVARVFREENPFSRAEYSTLETLTRESRQEKQIVLPFLRGGSNRRTARNPRNAERAFKNVAL